MAWIQPNSDIILYKGVPLSPEQKHSIWFDTRAHQIDYFNSFVHKNFLKQYYQRVNKNTCRLEVNAEEVYAYNYMSFTNTSFGSKQFYAFITNVEYVNHNVTEITYEIDDIQTWFFADNVGARGWILGECFVEREHSTTDYIGEHILAEPVDVGEHICDSITAAGFSPLSIIMNVTLTQN